MSFALRNFSSRIISALAYNGVGSRSCSTGFKPNNFEKSINQVTLLGRCGSQPEMRGNADYPVVQFSLATHQIFFKGGEPTQNTVWHRISVFKPGLRDLVLNHITKGARIFLQGRLGYYEKRDPDTDLVTTKTASIIADEIVFLNREGKDDGEIH